MEKLVRDKIPEIMEAAGVKCSYRIAKDDEDFRPFAVDKIYEELGEFGIATWPSNPEHSKEALANEAADILATLINVAKLNSGIEITVDEVAEAYKKKAEERGLFDKRIIATFED